MIKSICIITDDYPTKKTPRYPFVEQLVLAWANQGIKCLVLCPASLTHSLIRRTELKKKDWTVRTEGEVVKVRCDRFLSMATTKIGNINTSKYTLNFFIRACDRYLSKHYQEFDVLYGHFIYPSGIAAARLGKKYGIPSFYAYGENTFYTMEFLGDTLTKKLLKGIRGVISVSTRNKNILIERGYMPEALIGIFPNAIDHSLFFPRSREEMRKKYGWSQQDFIIIFVGGFIEIKGPDRLSKAIGKLNNSNIRSIFIGSGEVKPECDGILWEGKVEHNQIPEFLSAADIFVLPTLAEGCCNAIIEAMACGLPVISSDCDFNKDILDASCSILIDPRNADEISEAIAFLYSNPKERCRLSEGALKKVQSMNINTRAKQILEFLDTHIEGR